MMSSRCLGGQRIRIEKRMLMRLRKAKKKNGRFARLGKHGESKSCGFCGEKGHNRTGCPHRKYDPRPDIPAAKGNPSPGNKAKRNKILQNVLKLSMMRQMREIYQLWMMLFHNLQLNFHKFNPVTQLKFTHHSSRRKSCKRKLQELQCKRASAHEMSQEMSQIPVETQVETQEMSQRSTVGAQMSLKAQSHKERPTSTPNAQAHKERPTSPPKAQAPLPPKPASSTPY